MCIVITKKTSYPLDEEICEFHANNLERYGVAILPWQVGKTLQEIKAWQLKSM